MTKNSYICELISSNPNNWRDILTEKRIEIKEDGPLAIFNYDIKADFRDPVVKEARGIIINTEIITVVCWPFRKFGNYHENYADTIDWSTAKVQEKVDGSICKLWFNELTGVWQWASNACIDISKNKIVDTDYFKAAEKDIYWRDVIESTKEHSILAETIQNDILDKSNTYIFELVSEYNHVVVNYPESRLYLIGIRNNITGIETPISEFPVEIRQPKLYDIHSFEDCIEAAKKLNNGKRPEEEGFVVVDGNFNRIKVKNPQYLIFHHGIFNVEMTMEQAYTISQFDDFDLELFREVAATPVVDKLELYLKKFAQTEEEIADVIQFTNDLACMKYSRKDIAAQLKGNKYSCYAFKSLDEQLPVKELIKMFGPKVFLRAVS